MVDPATLYAILNNTNLQQNDNKLYQFLRNLIGILIVINNKPASGSGSVGPIGPQGIPGLPGLFIGLDGESGEDGMTIPGSSSGSGSGLTNAQIAARILLDAPGGGLASSGGMGTGQEGPVGPEGPQGIQGIQGVQGNTGQQGLPGLDGESAEDIIPYRNIDMSVFAEGDQVLRANFKPDTTQMFSWQSKSNGVVYLAPCDGLVIAYGTATIAAGIQLTLKSDSSNPPTTVRQAVDAGNLSSGTIFSITGAVRKGDYWEVVDGQSTGTATWWVPLGTAG